MIFGFAYVSFELIYILGFGGTNGRGNDYIYCIQKWKTEPLEAIGWFVFVLVVIAIAHGILCLWAFIRDKLWQYTVEG